MTEKYTVENIYGINGGSTHRTAAAAIREAGKREGEGWIVTDRDGNQWESHNGRAYIVRYGDD